MTPSRSPEFTALFHSMRDQSSIAVHRFSIALCGVWTALWLAANLAWLQKDRLVRDGAFVLAADPTLTYVPPGEKEPVPYLNFAPVQNAVARLEASATRYDGLMESTLAGGGLDNAELQLLNGILRGLERRLTWSEGLPRRPWFRHQIYAPGFWTGYGVKTLPGIREGIEERAWEEVRTYVDRVAEAVNRMSDGLDEAALRLGG